MHVASTYRMPLASCLAFALTGAMHLQVVHCPKIAIASTQSDSQLANNLI